VVAIGNDHVGFGEVEIRVMIGHDGIVIDSIPQFRRAFDTAWDHRIGVHRPLGELSIGSKLQQDSALARLRERDKLSGMMAFSIVSNKWKYGENRDDGNE
jgi:beta-phosphoglucomutase-like phosphatase (HAD superfamily)